MAWLWKKEYRAWLKMLSRCHDEADLRYARYGGRGITVCDRWRDPEWGFHWFCLDMGRAPTRKHTLERNDNDKGYAPDNCRWATWKEQAQNRRSNVRLTVGKRTLTMAQWADRLHCDRRVIWKRLRLGWPVPAAVTTPVRRTA